MAPILSSAQVQQLDKTSLFEFLSLKMTEGSQIDYKEDLSGETKNEKYKEFLKDITAFANAHGGLLLLGIKEPSDDLTPEMQTFGIVDGDKIAKDLERVASTSVDPRIPGVLIKSINIQNNRHAIIVYIPPSLIRPHMVSHQKHRCFYIRHSESSVPMTTHEIRDTVLSSATLEGRARSYAQEEEYEALEYVIHERPAFLLQAVPLLSLESPWEVLVNPIEKIVRGEDRASRYTCSQFNLETAGLKPTPTLKGILGRDNRNNETWLTEIHRSGFIQVIYMDIKQKPDDPAKFGLHQGYADLFRAFCDLCESLWKVTQTDIPYLFRSKYYNAEKTCLQAKGRYGYPEFTNVYNKSVISLPEQMRQAGEPVDKIPIIWTERLFNAFGLNCRLPDNPAI
jgi:hypothetical protein